MLLFLQGRCTATVGMLGGVLILTARMVYNTRMKLNTIICAAAVCGCASFATAAEEPANTETTEPSKAELSEEEQGEEEEDSLVSAEFYLGVDSKYITYGVMDGKDPIVRANGYVTFLDWWYIGGEMLFDVTKGNGKRGPYGWGNRAGKYTTIDAQTGLAHEFDLGETLGTLSVDVYYTYEYVARHKDTMNDTQYIDFELRLNDLWFEP